MSSSGSSSEEEQNAKSKEEPKLKPKTEIRSVPLIHALKTFVVDHVMKHYTVAGIRALMKPDSKHEIWQVRQILENKFSEEKHIVGFVSCGTALKTKYKGQDVELPGISFFVMFDWPECAIDYYENHLSEMVMNSGLDLYNCKALRGRSKFNFEFSYVRLQSIYFQWCGKITFTLPKYLPGKSEAKS